MRYSNFAKIVDKDSEYYGQVFEVEDININKQDVVLIEEKYKGESLYFIGKFSFSQIQFCVTKDNEPVKIEKLSFDDFESPTDKLYKLKDKINEIIDKI
jgi:hypothetical protein